ncbi:MAG: M15 family metallopeptidase [Ruminococcus sp.]|nr:M15 family metallopeptidase [Candidatus Copronaster equi]
MNRKFTSKTISFIVLQSLMIIIAITVVGNAVITHAEYKASTEKIQSSQSDNKSKNTPSKTVKVTEPVTAGKGYKYAYAGLNPEIVKPGIKLDEFMLSTQRILPDDYTPTIAQVLPSSSISLDYRAVPYYRAMYDAAKRSGITLTPISGYVSIEEQAAEFDEYVSKAVDNGKSKKSAALKAIKKFMLPGADEHNAGLAIDICSEAESFEDTNEFAWLQEHSADYGFILRYPKDKESVTGVEFKPWCYRFVGVEAAKTIKANNYTLEEYIKNKNTK